MDTDAHNRNREILETMIPRESPSRRIDFATFISISFPAFSLSNGTEHLAHKLYNKTKKDILTHLSSVSLKTRKNPSCSVSKSELPSVLMEYCLSYHMKLRN